MRKVAITGGGGFVGQAVARQLLSQGIETVIIGRNRYPLIEKAGAALCQGDIRSLNFLIQAFQNCDTVFHVAAKAGVWGDYQDYYSINVSGTENVIKACQVNTIPRLVYTSTPSVVFNSEELCGVDESTPYADRFLCHYAETKATAEKAVLAANSEKLKTTALRPHLIWGPGDTNLIPRLIERGRSGKLKKVGEGENLVDISYIDNVASAHLLAAKNLEEKGAAAGKAYFISQGEPVNLWQWINSFFQMVGIAPLTNSISFKKARLIGSLMEKMYSIFKMEKEPLMTRFVAEQLAHSHWFSIEAARKELGYHPSITTETGMKRTAEWVNNVML